MKRMDDQGYSEKLQQRLLQGEWETNLVREARTAVQRD